MKGPACLLLVLSLFLTAGVRMPPSGRAKDGRRTYTFVVAGDPHYGDEYSVPGVLPRWSIHFQNMVRQIQPDAVLLGGDLYANFGHDDSLGWRHADSVAFYVRTIGPGRPVYASPGNHDAAANLYHPGTTGGVNNQPTREDSLYPWRYFSAALPNFRFDGLPYAIDFGKSLRVIVYTDQMGGFAEACSTAYRPFVYWQLTSGMPQPAADPLAGRFLTPGSANFNAIQALIKSWDGEWLFLLGNQGRAGAQGSANAGDYHWQQACNPAHPWGNLIEDTRTAAGMGVDVAFQFHQHEYWRRGPTKNNLLRLGKTSRDSSIIEICGPNINGSHSGPFGTYADSAAWLLGTFSPDTTLKRAAGYSGAPDSAYIVNHWMLGDQLQKYDSFAGADVAKPGSFNPGMIIIRISGLTLNATVVDSTWKVVDRWGINK